MNASLKPVIHSNGKIMGAIKSATDSVAPTWPLDRMIAVNPYWGRVQNSFQNTAQDLTEIAGSMFTMPLSYYLACWQAGEISERHLQQAISERSSTLTVAQAINGLQGATKVPSAAPLLSDVTDSQRDLIHQPAWCDTITHQIAQFCAAYFDQDQADWHPDQNSGLYASWQRGLMKDHSVALLMKAPEIPSKAADLEQDPQAQIEQALNKLGVPAEQWSKFLQAVIMRVSGWASWCAYLKWQAKLANSDDRTLIDLLAIRLSWECLVDDGERHLTSIWASWQTAWKQHFEKTDESGLQLHLLWQRAQEISYQNKLCNRLLTEKPSAVSAQPKVQAVFCIDVRSEVFRRHLEAQSPDIQTLGFAGFFGLPISYTPIGTSATRPQLPGLLAPAMDISDSSGNSITDQNAQQQRELSLKNLLSWRPFQSAPGSAYTLVETLGIGYAGKLLRRSLPSEAAYISSDHFGFNKTHQGLMRPSLTAKLVGDLTSQTNIASQVLKAMNLSEGFAPLVLLVGHGSQTQNNPQRAGLDCGACCGQTGEVNSRALANLLNDSAVRQQLKQQGSPLPDSTVFVAALHNTTTDEVLLFDTDLLPVSHAEALCDVQAKLASAGLQARRERAPALGLEALVNNATALTKAVKQRANDWAQTRPEWGLANNAAFIVASRARTRGLNLEGRTFLHEYDHSKDTDGALIELIMTAPMIVTHWINMQYYASTVDNKRYGSGNKTLHNVVGGRLGVFEGNGGDLRIGLAWQSIHDGKHWRHEPLRITVVIDAPREMIEAVIAKHENVRVLLNNQWLYLARFEEAGIAFYQDNGWKRWENLNY